MTYFDAPRSLSFAAPGPFARAIAARAAALMRDTGENRFADRAQWIRGGACFAFALFAYIALLARWNGPGLAPALIVLAAFFAFMTNVQLAHDASHGAMSRHGWVNEAIVFAVLGLIGIDGPLWRDRHVRLHHRVPNAPGTGIDADGLWLVRLAPDHPRRAHHRFQLAYAPLIYAIGHAHTVWVDDLACFRAGRRASPTFAGRFALARFIAGKLLHVSVFIVLPWLALRPSVTTLFAAYLLATMVIGYSFVVLVVGTHVSSHAEFPTPGPDGRLPHDWATHQLATSVDWSPESRLAALPSGGANAHVAHHLFPGYSHRHGAALSRIIAQAAAENGLRHRAVGFRSMVAGHVRHLIAMGVRDD